jgi:hypothetical protein
MTEEMICAICLDPLGRRKLHVTDCLHKFHSRCFQQVKTSTCPYCRSETTPTIQHQIQLLRNDVKVCKDELHDERRCYYWEIQKQMHLIENLKEKMKREQSKLLKFRHNERETIAQYKKVIDIAETRLKEARKQRNQEL